MTKCAETQDRCVRRLTRLKGDESTAKDAARKLRSIIEKVDRSNLEAESMVFKAMSNPTRLTILKLLKEGELCVCEIMTALDRPQSTTSHHLNILKNAGLVKERKEGNWSHYRLSDGAIIQIMNLVEILAE